MLSGYENLNAVILQTSSTKSRSSGLGVERQGEHEAAGFLADAQTDGSNCTAIADYGENSSS